MKRLCAQLAAITTLVGTLSIAPPPVSAAVLEIDCRIVSTSGAGILQVEIPKGEFRGRWSLEIEGVSAGLKIGQKGRIRAPRRVMKARKGPVRVEFKGSDEELQALIDWLGTLE